MQRLRDELQSAIEELQASSEEHKAAAEEAMSTNEELQSSNEELETSKEEMQSLNEELTTVNAQLHGKMEELQRTSGDLRSLLASTDIAVIFLDSQFRIRRYTPAVRKLLELIGSDVGRPVSDLAKKFVDPDLLDDAQSVLDHLVPVEREVRSDDGRWYARRVLPYRTVEDRIEGVVITFVDISDRKRAQDLAAQASAVVSGDLKAMHSLQTATNLLIGANDVPGVLEEILIAALELHATSQGELALYEPTSQTLRVAAHRGLSAQFLAASLPASLSDPASPAARALRERRLVRIDDVEGELPPALRDNLLGAGARALLCIPLLARDGELLGVMTLHFPDQRPPDERSLHVTEILVRLGADTLERMRIEEERGRLLRSEQLARRALDDAAHMKDAFLATLSHELRTPLSAILLWGKLLRKTLVEPDKLKAVDAIVSSAQAQGRLIEDLLDSAAAAAGKVRLDPTEMDLAQTVRSVIDQHELAARAKNVRVEAELSPHAGLVVADATRIRQVVWNLLANAVKFTPDGGVVTLSVAREGNDVRLCVSDTGIGIAPDFLPHIFDRFRQYEASITRRYGGLGLGLTICKQLVELHGGTIRAESAGVNQGATFVVSLPLPAVRPSEPPPAAEGHEAEAPLSGGAILLVEDDLATQSALLLFLEHAGGSVTTASSGVEALELYRVLRP
ncbi:MAG TPA: ATP-binding protein, partial [Polyangiaceae bacterium]|nr:ATP-binding protein [Polyangiaceae bacterium]